MMRKESFADSTKKMLKSSLTVRKNSDVIDDILKENLAYLEQKSRKLIVEGL